MMRTSNKPARRLVFSPTLVIVPVPASARMYNAFAVFDRLKKAFAYYPCETLHWMIYFREMHTFQEVRLAHPHCACETLCAEIEDLVARGFLITEEDYNGPLYGAYRQARHSDRAAGPTPRLAWPGHAAVHHDSARREIKPTPGGASQVPLMSTPT